MAKPKNIKKRRTSKIVTKNKNRNFQYAIIVFVTAVVGTLLLTSLWAANPQKACDPSGNGENGYLYPFCREDAGAKLPIQYDLSSLPSDSIYVADNGNDSASGSSSAPFKTLAKAIGVAKNKGTIVVKKGTYREGRLTVNQGKTLRIVAYPGDTPVFSGSVPVNGGWATDGNLKYISYTPRPVTNGSGIDFIGGQNLTGDGVGKYPDQAWIGNNQLKQVSQKSSVVNGTFWVDSTNGRLYMTSADAGKSGIEVSGNKGRFITVNSPDSVLEGITVSRFSNTPNDYGVVLFQNTADRSGMRNVRVTDSAFISVMFTGDKDVKKIQQDGFIENTTVEDAGWMGISATFTDNLSIDYTKVRNMNMFEEFTTSPQSGGLKTSRTYFTRVTNSDFSDNKSHSIWFDQSNRDAEVVGNIIADNKGTGVFWEISDGVLIANNFIRSTGSNQAVKLAGSSGIKLVNNTIIGGRDPVGLYTDSRSMPGCADPSKPDCYDSKGTRLSWGGDKDTVRPYRTSLDFMPRIDLMLNNVIAYPTSTGYCSKSVLFCITSNNHEAVAPLATIIHKADLSRGIPQTVINGNVYANGSNPIFGTSIGNFNTVTDFTAAMAKSPVLIAGLDANSKEGNKWVNKDGTPTSALVSAYSQAVAIPTDAVINKYIAAGTKRYGIVAPTTATTPPPAQNQPPQITLAALEGSYTQPVDITLSANATDSDGSVVKVEFFNGNTKLGEVTGNGPYRLTWKNVPAGTHSITARATDNQGATTISSSRTTVVKSKPVVSPPTTDTKPPSAPTNITRSLRLDWGRFSYVVDLRWTPSTDNSGKVESYQVARNGVVIGETKTTQFTDSSSLGAGVEYTYSVTAKDPTGNVSLPGITRMKASCFLVWCSID